MNQTIRILLRVHCYVMIADNYFEIFPKIPFANNTETLIFAFVVIHGVLTKIIYEKEIHI